MSLPTSITICPHCGSKDGYDYLLTVRGTQTQRFNEDVGLRINFTVRDSHHGSCRCVTCNKIISTK